jgi:alkylation response protein AidB-like acyl-CoA dehydrogenase
MATTISHRNLRFLLHEVLQVTDLQRFEYYKDYDKDAFDMALDAAKQIADNVIEPYNKEMDKFKVTVPDGRTVHVHPQLKEIIKAIAEGGWIGSGSPYEVGGSQMPIVLNSAGIATFYAASVNACYPFLTNGAANLILTFGSEQLKNDYIPSLYSGKWQGTMALTEPQAGSSLSDLTTSATPTDRDGVFKIKGQKIYISGGDHDAVDNIVHLLLARIDGAPSGTKGISLFVVPKYRLDGSDNDVTTAGVYGKMGQKNYVAAHLMYGEADNCEGYLVGEPHKGLSYMFQMMNEARIGTGLVGFANASAAYYAALKYANERPQGRHLSNKDLSQPPVLIIEHADVRRMLLLQKAIVEGGIALLMECSLLADIAHVGEGEEKENANLLLELLTPIAKTYPSEMGIVAVKNAMQTLGGAGYCDDFPIEQYYREIPINTIYEGTTTIHGLDILGRKVMMKNGKAVQLLAAEVMKIIGDATLIPDFQPLAQKLGFTAQKLNECTMHLIGLAQKERPEVFLADATLFLEYFGTFTIAWQWLKQAVVAHKALSTAEGEQDINFYKGKIHTAKFFFEYELPKTRPLHEKLMNDSRLTLDIDTAIIC